MIVCVCKRISDSHIRAAISAGADSFEAVQAQLGLSTCCGRCEDFARGLVSEHVGSKSPVMFYPAGFQLQMA
jgi:bacterioferritin-associated ferredoxin